MTHIYCSNPYSAYSRTWPCNQKHIHQTFSSQNRHLSDNKITCHPTQWPKLLKSLTNNCFFLNSTIHHQNPKNHINHKIPTTIATITALWDLFSKRTYNHHSNHTLWLGLIRTHSNTTHWSKPNCSCNWTRETSDPQFAHIHHTSNMNQKQKNISFN